MIFTNLRSGTKLLKTSASIKNQRIENQIELNRKFNYSKSHKALKTFKQIYTQISGKNIVVQSSKENHLENMFFEKLMIMEILNAYYSSFSILSSVSYYEFSYGQSDQSSLNYRVYLYVCTIFSICLWVNLFLEEIIKLQYDVVKKLCSKNDNIFTSGRYKIFLLKLFIFFLHPNPICSDITYSSENKQVNLTVERKINYIFCLIILFRFYFIFRFFIYMSSYISPESNRICKKYFFEADVEYAMKSLVENSPIKTYSVSLIIFVLCFSFTIRVFERDIQKDFNLFWNSIYYVLITMTTVGYGDISAKTNEGRTIAMVSCIVGVFLISMMIISVNKILSMSSVELNSLLIMERIYSNKDLEESAKTVILSFSKILKSKNARKKNVKDKALLNLRSSIKQFNEIYHLNKTFGENTFNSIYNTISVVLYDQEVLFKEDKKYSLELLKLKKELKEVYQLMKKKHRSTENSFI